MKRMNFGKQLVPVAMVLSMVGGCASAPPETPAKDNMAEVNQAIDAAKASIAKAEAVDWMWRDTEDYLKEAETEAAAGAGHEELAIKLANKARNQADLAVNQYYLEHAKAMYAKASKVSSLNASQQSTLAEADKAIRNAEGRKAYDLLTPLLTELGTAANIEYQVVRGDSLWSIAGRQGVYDNPYQWPLIYKANRDHIKDADLIYPGQDFTINRNPSAAEAEMAVNHAKTRGAWSIGVVEESDRNYLGGSLDLQ
jgi:nucleoid-associated protein YgaU